MGYIGRTPTGSILTGADIADGSISTAKLADTAVSTAKIADNAIVTGKITDGTIATADIANSAVTSIKTSGVGITNADQFRLTSNFTGDAQPITSNLSRVSEVGAAGGALGSQMAVSSGIFTFPSTGIYLVEFVSQATWTSTSFFHTASIQVTTNNSSYTSRGEGDLAVTMGADSGTWYQSNYISFLLDVTDTANVKVRFGIDAYSGSVTTRGNTNTNLTYMTFTRLGDT